MDELLSVHYGIKEPAVAQWLRAPRTGSQLKSHGKGRAVGFDLIQQRVLFWPEEAPQAEAVAHAIDARDATALDRCLRANGELTLGLLDWAMRQAHEAQDALMLEWCLEQDRLLRGHVGGKQEFGDAYAARLAWRRGVLRPVIGAGVSQAVGAPGWAALVGRCLDTAAILTADPERRRGLQAMSERLQGGLGGAGSAMLVEATQAVEDLAGMAFAAFVRGALANVFYGPSDFRPPKSDLHCALAELAMVGGYGPGVADVVTYNFDELFEMALIRHYGTAVTVASFGGKWKQGLLGAEVTTPIRVWHPHGFLPQFPTPLRDPPDLVFSVKAYEQQYGNASSLASKIVDDSLRTRVCLFVGSAFEDAYQRAQLQRAHAAQPGWYHYAIMKLPAVTRRGQFLSRRQYDTVSQDLVSLGVRPLWINDYDMLPAAIRKLSQGAGFQVVTANHRFCAGPAENLEVAALYQQLNAPKPQDA